MHTIFIQFYWNRKLHDEVKLLIRDNYETIMETSSETVLSNGFSSVYHKCKSMGDFVWIPYDLNGGIKDILKKNDNIELPIKSGTAYVSCFYNLHLYQVFKWAVKYPKIKFIVGGPAVDKNKIVETLPSNLLISEDSIVSLLRSENSWNISLPPKTNDNIYLGYPVERTCYWGKCNFCNYSAVKERTIDINHDILSFISEKNKISLFLYTPAASPNFMMNVLPKLKSIQNVEYIIYVRGDDQIAKILETSLNRCVSNGINLKNITLIFGVEFPSKNMLQFMNKGVSIESLYKTFTILSNYHCNVGMNILLGWNNLKEIDVSQAQDFFYKLSDISKRNIIVSLLRLNIKPKTPIEKDILSTKPFKLGPFLFGYTVKLTKEQRKQNDMVRNQVYQSKFYYIRDWYFEEKYNDHALL